MSEIEYILKSQRQTITFNEDTLTFSINHIKSRLGSVLYFRFNCYNKEDEKIYTYTSPRWYIDVDYTRKAQTFTIPSNKIDDIYSTDIELITIGTDSENPLYFAECMLNEGDDLTEYHIPHEQVQEEIGLMNSRYVNLYQRDGNYLQVIRPTGDKKLRSDSLTKSTCTVLAPHLHDELEIDNAVNVFLEFLHQREQVIDVLR